MPLEPRVRHIVRTLNRLDTRPDDQPMPRRRASSAAVARRGARLVMPAGPAMASIDDRLVPVDGGRIVVRLYHPRRPGPLPLHVFLHGGGWCLGTLDERDARCRAIAHGASCVVASVDYRLAPENAFPTGAEDCYRALCELVADAPSLGIDPDRVSVGGESAGGNLAAVVALMARDRGGPALCHQWLDVPAVDLTLAQPSMTEVPDGLLLDRRAIEDYLDCYLGPERERATDPYASPLLADDLSGLPPAWIMSCGHDKLRDDGIAYAEALRAAGVPATHTLLDGHVHPSFAFTRILRSAAAYERDAIAALARAYATPDG